MKNWMTFHSNLSDPHTEDEAGKEVLEPAGGKHIQLLLEFLALKHAIATPLWNEEDFAWEFLCTIEGITFGILLQESWDEGGEPEGNWLLIVEPLLLFKWLLRRRISRAFAIAEDEIAAWIANDNRLSDLRQYTYSEYTSLCHKLNAGSNEKFDPS